jgi:asparagine N-glycosylation enzyme membrane subunit Stt3
MTIFSPRRPEEEGRSTMLFTIAIILFIMWLLGMVSSYTVGGFLHVLLVLAIAAVLIRVIQGRRPL